MKDDLAAVAGYVTAAAVVIVTTIVTLYILRWFFMG